MEGGHLSDHSHHTTPHKERDGVHVKELGKEFLKLFKRKKKKEFLTSPLPIHPPSSFSDTKEEHSDPVSFRVQNLAHTPPTHSEVTQHTADARSPHVARSATSLTDASCASGGATSAESVDHEGSVEDGNKKKDLREERRARYRSQGVYVVADEDDHTDFEESHCPFRVDRHIIDRLQWKDGVVPADFEKPKKPRFKKRKEEKDDEKLKHQNEIVLKDAIPLDEAEKKKKKEEGMDGVARNEGRMKASTPIDDGGYGRVSRKRRKKEEKKDEDGKDLKDSIIERRRGSKEAITPVEEKTPRKKSTMEKKKEELKDAIPLEEKKKSKEVIKDEMQDAIPLKEEKVEKKKKDKEKEKGMEKDKDKEKEDEEGPVFRKKNKRDEAVEDGSDQEKRRKKKGDDGMEDAIAMVDRSAERKKKSREEGKKNEEKGKEEKKEEKKKEEKREGGEGKKKEARGEGGKDEENSQKSEGKEKERRKEEKKRKEEDTEMKGERETREARKKEEEKIGEKEDSLAVVPYEEWPVPALVEKVDGLIGYRVLTGGYKAAYFGYVCLHVGASFFSHMLSFDFTRSVPPSISKVIPPLPPRPMPSSQKLTPRTSEENEREEKRKKSFSESPSRKDPPTKRIVVETPVDYSSLSVHSSDEVEVTMCH